MAKKVKPPIAPRRPPPVVPPEALEDFIRGTDSEGLQTSKGARERSEAAVDVSGAKVSPASASSDAHAESAEIAKVEPGTATSAVAHERFRTSADASGDSQMSGKVRGIVAREGGRVRRRRTIYLPPDLDERLETWCIGQGREVSHAVAEAIRRMLGDAGT
jgi:hypothetical protein